MPKFSSFNAYGSEAGNIGQSHIPVWLGTVTPVPVGGTLVSAFLKKGLLLGAGFPVKLDAKEITPFIGWVVKAFTAGDGVEVTTDSIFLYAAELGGVKILPEVGDFIMRVGSAFSSTGKAAEVTAVDLVTEGDNAGTYEVKVAHAATVDTPSAGSVIAISSAVAAGSSKSLKVIPNGYLYNDIYLGDLDDSDAAVSAKTIAATGAVVKFHSEGLLVELTPASAVKAQMAAAVPGVLQVLV